MGNGQQPPGGDHHQQEPRRRQQQPHGQSRGQGQPYGWPPQEQRPGRQPASAPWSVQTVPSGLPPPHPGPPPPGGSRRSEVIAVVAATTVVPAAGIIGSLVLGPAVEGKGRHRGDEAVHDEVRHHRERGDGHLDRCRQDGPLPLRRQPVGETVSWTCAGVRGVHDEVPKPTAQKILSTVRLIDSTP